MTVVQSLLAGVVLALALVFVARCRPPEGERRVYAVGLLAAAVVYVAFAAAGGASAAWLGLESLGVLGFGALAWLGVRRSSALLAAGWAAHVLWDVLLHLSGTQGAAYTPGWYPWLCVGFDLVIAAALLAGPRQTK